MKIRIDHPHIMKGEEIGISGLVSLKNGESADLDDTDVELFEQETGRPIAETFAYSEIVKLGDGSAQKKARKDVPEPELKEFETPIDDTGWRTGEGGET